MKVKIDIVFIIKNKKIKKLKIKLIAIELDCTISNV